MRLFITLATLFIVVPWLEIVILLKVAARFGAMEAIVVVLATGFAGAALARHQGTKAWQAIRRTLRAGGIPSREILDGFFILCAGLLLVTPGLLTDSVGFLFLLPPFRGWVGRLLARRFRMRMAPGGMPFGVPSPPSQEEPPEVSRQNGEIIDVEAERIDLDSYD